MSNCDSCPTSGECNSKEECMIENNPLNSVKKVIAVMSGKGGVGKSTVSALLARQLNKKGFKVGVLDADITGPSIPRLLNLENVRAAANEQGIMPVTTECGIKVMSLNLLIEDEEAPVIWRGPAISGVVKQFWTDVIWGELDYLIIDMPPGTGDVALTVMQSIPINGVVMVSIPQDLVSMIVAKAINMARKMDIKVLGIVENMSYVLCPDCEKEIRIFDSNNIQEFVDKMHLQLLGELPMTKSIINAANNVKDETNKVLQDKFESITDKIISSVK